MTHYSIISSDGQWSYNYNDEVCEKHKSIGRDPYKFSDLALAKKCLEELEDNDFSIVDSRTGEKIKLTH